MASGDRRARVVSTFIRTFETEGTGIRLAVKDLIDMAGEVTTAGCLAVAEAAVPAGEDASCLRGARQAGARIVGRTNLHELALGVTGINPWFGTPENVLDAGRVPGGSSSGSAVAVASGAADVAFGTDTGGSVRIPAACCGVCGLKTTYGRVSLRGVWPLSPSFDTVGPIAPHIAGLITGMALLEPGFAVGAVGRLRVGVVDVEGDADILEAVWRAVRSTGWEASPVEIPSWEAVSAACLTVLLAEAWTSNRSLVATRPDGIGRDVLDRLALGRAIGADEVSHGRERMATWTTQLDRLFEVYDLLVTPTLTIPPPLLDEAVRLTAPPARCTLPVNFAGVPAVAMPVPCNGSLPASVQLIGPRDSEERLLAAALELERCVPPPAASGSTRSTV